MIDYANRIVPSCLTHAQRRQFRLPPQSNKYRLLVKEGENLAQEGNIKDAIEKFKQAKQLVPCFKFPLENDLVGK
ncbi:hypothetical protein QUF82_13425 [Thiotrichales bacterium HSG14]|nr:hypothetical protein [Thiotrichales bacterium HSG14]